MKICQKCGKEFPKIMWIDGIKRIFDTRKMCVECSPFRMKSESQTFVCPKCGKNVIRNKGEMTKNKTGNFFCSRSCSAIFTNKTNPKRKPEGSCEKCGKIIKKKNKFCKTCLKDYKNNIAIKNAVYSVVKNKRTHQRNSRVREHARQVFDNANIPYTCIVCGYDKHVDICHIKGISTFDKNTLIKEINDISNLIPLCKNHHWEFDHNTMSQEDMEKINSYLGKR